MRDLLLRTILLRHAAAFIQPTIGELRRFVRECDGRAYRSLVWTETIGSGNPAHSRVRFVSGRLVMALDESNHRISVVDADGCWTVGIETILGAFVGRASDAEIDDLGVSLSKVSASVLPQLQRVDDVWPGPNGTSRVYFAVRLGRPELVFVSAADQGSVEMLVVDPVGPRVSQQSAERLWAIPKGSEFFEPTGGGMVVTAEFAAAVGSMPNAEEAYLLLMSGHQQPAEELG